MKKLFLFLIVALVSLTVKAQTSDYENDIMKFLEVNGSSESYDMIYDQLVTQYKMMKPDVPQDFWDSAKKDVFDKEIESLNKQLIPIYQKYFTHDDIKQLIEFYTSGIGKKLTSGSLKVAEETTQISQPWAMSN